MNDPHVESLKYNLKLPEYVAFQDPPPFHLDTSGYTLDIENDVLTVTMKDHYSKENDARAVVEPFLRAWELDDGLKLGRPSLTFRFAKAVLKDRAPTPGNETVVPVAIHATVSMSADAFLQAVLRTYPAPPTQRMEVTPEVEYMWSRFAVDIDRKENLLVMGYYCLTMAARVAGGRHNAPEALRISKPVISRLGNLTEQGHPMKARKIKEGQRPLTGAEERWVQEVVKSLIRRVAEFEANPTGSFTQITMADFPTI
jgi:hypothetical protein